MKKKTCFFFFSPKSSSSESTLVQIRQCLSRLHVHSTHYMVAHVKDPMATFTRRPSCQRYGNTLIKHLSCRIIRILIVATPKARTEQKQYSKFCTYKTRTKTRGDETREPTSRSNSRAHTPCHNAGRLPSANFRRFMTFIICPLFLLS